MALWKQKVINQKELEGGAKQHIYWWFIYACKYNSAFRISLRIELKFYEEK